MLNRASTLPHMQVPVKPANDQISYSEQNFRLDSTAGFACACGVKYGLQWIEARQARTVEAVRSQGRGLDFLF